MMDSIQRTLAIVLLLCVTGSTVAARAQDRTDGLAPHRAVYGLYNDAKRVGEAVFTLRYDAAALRYDFETRSEFSGLLRIASPRPLVEHSEFTVVGGAIRPLSFTYSDGSWRSKRNVALSFDWDHGLVTVEQAETREQIALPQGALDRASARIALMHDLAAGRLSGSYTVADPDVLQTYGYHSEGAETLDTALGEIAAEKISQQRPGSSRRTLIWAARDLGFLPVRIEQIREGRAPVSFVIESLEWLSDARP